MCLPFLPQGRLLISDVEDSVERNLGLTIAQEEPSLSNMLDF